MLTFSTSQTIVLVDDDPDDRIFMNESFLKIKWNENLLVFESGNSLFAYLDRLDEVYYPSLIILDYHLPIVKGDELLQLLKQNKRYKHIPVVVYSSEMSESMERSLLLQGAIGCYKKVDGYLAGIQFAQTLKLLSAPSEN